MGVFTASYSPNLAAQLASGNGLVAQNSPRFFGLGLFQDSQGRLEIVIVFQY